MHVFDDLWIGLLQVVQILEDLYEEVEDWSDWGTHFVRNCWCEWLCLAGDLEVLYVLLLQDSRLDFLCIVLHEYDECGLSWVSLKFDLNRDKALLKALNTLTSITALGIDYFFRQYFVDELLSLELYMLQLVLDDLL